MTAKRKQARPGPLRHTQRGQLRIGDEWNAIAILAQSQSHPHKAVAELVENAIDAHAHHIAIVRGRRQGQWFFEVTDDGDGVPRADDGRPNFQYVATHICDSMKRRLADRQAVGVHGEFGIGLLGFWSLGGELQIVSRGRDRHCYEMTMHSGQRAYSVRRLRGRTDQKGARVTVVNLHESVRKVLTGEKLNRYLAAELRDRIRSTAVAIHIDDHVARKQFDVVPKEFEGEPITGRREVATPIGPVHVELYQVGDGQAGEVGVFRDGTRVKHDIAELPQFDRPPWNAGRVEGAVDFAPLKLAPSTREGILPGEHYAAFVEAVTSLEGPLQRWFDQRNQAEVQRANRSILREVQHALTEALDTLPGDEYVWIQVARRTGNGRQDVRPSKPRTFAELAGDAAVQRQQRPEAGPLASLVVRPPDAHMPTRSDIQLTAIPHDADGHVVRREIEYQWRILDGPGRLEDDTERHCLFVSTGMTGHVEIEVLVHEGDTFLAEVVPVEVVLDLLPAMEAHGLHRLPGYLLASRPGERWRSRYRAERNLIEINSGHRDFAASVDSVAAQRRYIGKLYAKEMVRLNFPEVSAAGAMDRLIELLVRIEKRL